MNKRTAIVIGSSTLLALLLAAGFIYLKGRSRAVSVEQAVERYRAADSRASEKASPSSVESPTPSNGSVAPRATAEPTVLAARSDAVFDMRPLPPEGVYTYATKGYERVDVLGGSRHDYPERTTITVRLTECGLSERWDALSERWDDRQTCRSANGDELHRFTAHHEFFGHADERTYSCKGLAYPRAAKPGNTWENSCVSGESFVVTRLRAVAWEQIEVGGKAIRTLHVRADTELTGDQRGESHRDVWGAVDTGFSIREQVSISSRSNQPPFGSVLYEEEYEIRILSLEPRR